MRTALIRGLDDLQVGVMFKPHSLHDITYYVDEDRGDSIAISYTMPRDPENKRPLGLYPKTNFYANGNWVMVLPEPPELQYDPNQQGDTDEDL